MSTMIIFVKGHIKKDGIWQELNNVPIDLPSGMGEFFYDPQFLPWLEEKLGGTISAHTKWGKHKMYS
jgi:hypothetical protein